MADKARQATLLRRHIAAIPYTDRPVAHAAQSMTLRRDAPWGVRVPDPGTHCATSIRTTSRRGAIHGARPRVSAPLSVASQGAYPPRSVITSAGERGGADAAATGGVLGPPFAFASNEWWMRAQHFTCGPVPFARGNGPFSYVICRARFPQTCRGSAFQALFPAAFCRRCIQVRRFCR